MAGYRGVGTALGVDEFFVINVFFFSPLFLFSQRVPVYQGLAQLPKLLTKKAGSACIFF
jgi:hypothetical protein